MRAITVDGLSNGLPVTFDPAFSADLAGTVFEVYPMADGTLSHTAHPSEGGYEYCTIRTRVGGARRWAYRLARLSDLTEVTEAKTDERLARLTRMAATLGTPAWQDTVDKAVAR